MSPHPVIIFLNGPKQSGKSTIAAALQKALRKRSLDYMIVAHADPIARVAAHLFFEDPYIDMKSGDIKASPIPGFEHIQKLVPAGDMSRDEGDDLIKQPYVLRDWMVAFGNWIRQTLGTDALSRILYHVIESNQRYYVGFIVEGCRTIEDVEYIRDHVGAESCLLIRVYRDGATFEGDLGGYVEEPGCTTFNVENNASIEEVVATIMEKIK